MGPIAQFDKSFLQSLSIDESVWFDCLFTPVVCPLFYVETLADLEKAVKAGRTPEAEVGVIAEKFPDMSGMPCVYHNQAAISELLGDEKVPMTGQVPVPGGRYSETDGRLGVVYERSPESEAFSRWQDGKFLEVERDAARLWRATLSNINLEEAAKGLRLENGKAVTLCRSLQEARQVAESLLANNQDRMRVMRFVIDALQVPHRYQHQVIERWKTWNYPPLPKYAPYACHVATVEVFFFLAIASRLIGTQRPSNRVDLAYLNYVPFGNIFVSSDDLHRRCVPHFLRSDQEFVWGIELRNDLRRINEFYQTMPESVRSRGVMSFAGRPPADIAPLVARLLDKYAPGGRDTPPVRDDIQHSPEELQKINQEAHRLDGAPVLDPRSVGPEDRIYSVTINRKMRRKRGSWLQANSKSDADA
jgi:hypothetical protein